MICVGYAAQTQYDAAGETTETIDADGRASTFAYNGIGQEVGENWFTTTTTTGTPAETLGYTYNVAGLMQSASDQNISAGLTATVDTFGYDAEGDVTSESEQVPGLSPTVTLSDVYTAGDRTQLAAEIGDTNDFVNDYQYTFDPTNNLYGQMSEVTQSEQESGNDVPDKRVDFTYFAGGRFDTIARMRAWKRARSWRPAPTATARPNRSPA